jgi:hypothetical protein
MPAPFPYRTTGNNDSAWYKKTCAREIRKRNEKPFDFFGRKTHVEKTAFYAYEIS